MTTLKSPVEDVGFINRKVELKIITDLISAAGEQPKVLVLHGNSGWGKSALAEKCLRKTPGKPMVAVLAPQSGREIGVDALKSNLAAGLSYLGEQTGEVLSFHQHILARKGQDFARQVATILCEHLTKRFLGDDAVEVLRKVGTSVALRSAKGLPQDLTDEVSIYIGDCLNQHPLGLRIENAQGMTLDALDTLARYLADSKGAFAIVEFTDNASVKASTLDRATEVFEYRKLRPEVMKIERLHFTELEGEFRGRPQELIELLRNCYYRADGNLHPVRQIELIYVSDQKIAQDRAPDIETVWRTLSSAEKMIASLVVAHNASVEKELLLALLASDGASQLFPDFLDTTASLGKLGALLFLRVEQIVTIQHDSVAEFITSADSTQRLVVIAERTWLDFYKEILQRDDGFLSEPEVLQWLTYFAVQLDDVTATATYLERMGGLVLRTVAPRRLIDHFRLLRQRCATNHSLGARRVVEKLARQQALLFYEIGWIDEALEAMSVLDIAGDDFLQLLTAELQCSCTHFKDGILLVDRLLDDWETQTPRPIGKIALGRLIRIHGLRNDGNFFQCRAEYLNLFGHVDHLSDPPLRRAIYRYADVALASDADSDVMMSALEQALALSTESPRDEAITRIALSQHYGHAERLEEAAAQLERVSQLSSEIWFLRYMVVNNRAVIAAKSGSLLCAQKLFQECLLLATESTDVAIVRINLMIVKALLGQSVAAANLGEELASYIQKPDAESETKRCGAFNLYILHADRGSQFEAEHFLKLAQDTICEVDEAYWEEKIKTQVKPKLASIDDYYLTMMSHWYLSASPFEGIKN